MNIQGTYAVVAVADMGPAIEWYSKLMGRAPDQRPMDTLVQWWKPGTIGLQVTRDAARAGQSLVTIVTPVMADARAALSDAGLKLGPETRGDYGAIAKIDDPEGNRITLAEPPKR